MMIQNWSLSFLKIRINSARNINLSSFLLTIKNNHSKYVKMFTMTIYRGGHKMKVAIWKRFILTAAILSALVVFAGCQDNSADKENNESNADEIDEIVGIEPGSGTMDIAENAVEGYDLDVDLTRSEEHTSELQSRFDLVCRLL